jgi:hypothetical protein
MTQMEVLEFLVEKGPGRTEAELAKAIFGDRGEQPMVNQDCRMLEGRGLVERRGQGAFTSRTATIPDKSPPKRALFNAADLHQRRWRFSHPGARKMGSEMAGCTPNEFSSLPLPLQVKPPKPLRPD